MCFHVLFDVTPPSYFNKCFPLFKLLLCGLPFFGMLLNEPGITVSQSKENVLAAILIILTTRVISKWQKHQT